MNKGLLTTITILAAGTFALNGFAAEKKAKANQGEELYKAKCAACHPDGGNIMNAKKTLKKKDLAANKIKTQADIVKYLRAPGPGMTKFDAGALPDKEAKEIAAYIMKTFK
jgi:cytochrome c6